MKLQNDRQVMKNVILKTEMLRNKRMDGRIDEHIDRFYRVISERWPYKRCGYNTVRWLRKRFWPLYTSKRIIRLSDMQLGGIDRNSFSQLMRCVFEPILQDKAYPLLNSYDASFLLLFYAPFPTILHEFENPANHLSRKRATSHLIQFWT